jgi:hypothetical protein
MPRVQSFFAFSLILSDPVTMLARKQEPLMEKRKTSLPFVTIMDCSIVAVVRGCCSCAVRRLHVTFVAFKGETAGFCFKDSSSILD